MKYVRKASFLLFSLFSGLLLLGWRLLSFAFSALDYEADDEDDTTIWYNYRTGEIDPVKRYDGIYQDKL